MAENNPQDFTAAEIRAAASESVRMGADIRSQVHDITLRALRNRRFDRDGIKEVVRAVTEGTALGAERKPTGMRQAMSEALQGLDQALRTSAEAGGQALKQLTANGRSFSDTELKQALGGLRKLEDDFLETAGKVADSASEAVRPELRESLRNLGRAGTATGKQVAVTMGDFAQKFGAASFDATLTGLETAADLGQKFSLIASGILSGMADALRTDPKNDPTEPRGALMLRETVGVMADLPRLHEITSVFIRHGLGDVVHRIGIVNVLERAGEMLSWSAKVESVRLSPPERLRMAFEDLGPTFVKLGQVMATRVDLLPPAWITELEKLHSEVPPAPFETLLPELERSLGRSPFEVFRDLETQAQGSASIAQVHRAKLQDGTPVVLKIRRPGVRAKVDADLRILQRLAELVESEIPETRRYRPTEIAGQYARSLERELDLGIEARNLERFGASFVGDKYVVIPKVYREWTSETLNVQEHIVGIPGTDLAAVKAAGLDPKLLAARGADAILKMILVDGFFHADPHPGNVFYLPGNRMAVIDFGMVGRLSPVRRNQVIDLMAGLARMDEEAMMDTLLDWAGDAYVDEQKLSADVNELVFEFEGVPLKDIRIGTLLRRFAAIIREHSIVMPADLLLMFKAMITMEGLGRQYDPDFHFLDHLAPLLRRAIARRYRPAGMLRRGRTAVGQFVDVVSSIPRDLGRVLRDARRGKTRLNFDIKQLDSFGKQLDRSIGRATMGIMTASVVIGSSIVMTVQSGPQAFGMPLLTILGFAGYAMAFVNSVWIILGIWRAPKN